MSATHEGRPGAPPEGRYGRGTPQATARRLRALGAVLGAAAMALVVWFGWSYIAGQDVSGSLIGYKVVSDERVQVHLEVRKDADVVGVCTVRSRAEDGGEVGLRDVRIDGRGDRVDLVVEIRTKARATNAELVGCERAPR